MSSIDSSIPPEDWLSGTDLPALDEDEIRETMRLRRASGSGCRRFVRVVLMAGLVFCVLGGAALAVLWKWFEANIVAELPQDLSRLSEYRPATVCQVKARDGAVIDRFYVERRIWVPIAELPRFVPDAFVAAEDRRFYDHAGVDVLGIARAMMVNLQAGHTVQGGSTITQQLVKNLLVGNERSYKRKLKEAVLAYRVEKTLGKREILELYVNYVALGNGNYGVEAAARDYFGISAREIDPGQAALLAGLVPAPSRYSPRRDPELAGQRRQLVLRGMVREGFLDSERASIHLDDPVVVPREGSGPVASETAYITSVRREVRRLFGPDLPFQQGMVLHTALDRGLQQIATDAVHDALVDLTKRQGLRVALRRLAPPDWERWLTRAPRLERDIVTNAIFPPQAGRCFEALVPERADVSALRAGPFTFSLRDEDRSAMVRGTDLEADPKPLKALVQPGDIVPVCAVAPGEVRLDDSPWGQGAAVVIENRTGGVVAVVGGRNVVVEGFVRATQARRQPGSSFKPYVYGAALLEGRTQITTVVDAPIALPAGNGAMWSPKNYGGGYAGALPMREAFARSLNTVAVRLILDVGVSDVAELARAMGVHSPLRGDPTLALGSSEVTPMDQALGYTTIARLGSPTDPVWIERVDDGVGSELGRAGETIELDGRAVARLPGGPKPQALPPGIAYELLDMMRGVVQGGTAVRAKKPGFDRAGKTGTTNGFVDAWFVGMTPRYTIAVWIGTDGTVTIGDKETGGRAALPAWIRIAEALDDLEGERFPIPPEAVLVPWGGGWVGLGRGRVPPTVMPVPPIEDAPLPAFPGSG